MICGLLSPIERWAAIRVESPSGLHSAKQDVSSSMAQVRSDAVSLKLPRFLPPHPDGSSAHYGEPAE